MSIESSQRNDGSQPSEQQQPQDQRSGEGAASAYARLKHQRDHNDRVTPKEDPGGIQK